ncbi:MAG: hypothetical protein ACRDJ2_08985 [Actinomycetota bacterium]
MVRYGTSLKNRIHAILADQGLRIEVPKVWTGPGRRWLNDVELRGMQRGIVTICCCCWTTTAAPHRPAQAPDKGRGQARPARGGAPATPGVGYLTAMMLVAEIAVTQQGAGRTPARRVPGLGQEMNA